MVLSEFLSAMGTGRFMLSLICCIGAGIMIGGGVRSLGGKIGWTIPAMVVIVGVLVTSGYTQSLLRAAETGALPSGFFDNFVIFTITVCVALYMGSMMLTTYGRTLQEADLIAATEALGPDDIAGELDVIAAHPAVAHGWFGDRWNPMSVQERRRWVQQNIAALHELRQAGGDHGFAGHDLHLPVRLAEIDLRGGT